MLKFIETDAVPVSAELSTVYVLNPQKQDEKFYKARTDRNVGWITKDEQELLRSKVVSIAGTGGMGGQISQTMVRLGIGEIRIADPESFDISNINRQLAAGIHTIGLSKALETARVLRNICDDYKLIVYPQGIEQKMLETFVPGSDVIIDEIEFWNIGSCILMHKMARSLGIPIFNCLTVGFATYLHYFTPESTPVETMLGIELEEALELEQKVLDGSILEVDRNRLMRKTLDCFIPRLPQYFSGPSGNTNHDLILERLEFEGTASIISTNPPVSAGIVANHVLFELLRNCGEQRSIGKLPSSPGYIMFDSAHLEIEIVRDRAK